jgi:hypothetical protein
MRPSQGAFHVSTGGLICPKRVTVFGQIARYCHQFSFIERPPPFQSAGWRSPRVHDFILFTDRGDTCQYSSKSETY